MTDVRSRLHEVCRRHGLREGAVAQLETLLALVQAEPTSVTAVRDPRRAVDLHVADSLAGLAVDDLRRAAAICDVGTGAGFPGLALAVALPTAQLTLVESVRKKCDFLERAVAKMGVANVAVCCGRAEEWAAGLGTQDAVTARALAPLPVLVEYAAPLLAPHGLLVAWKGRPEPGEEADGAAAAAALGFEFSGVVGVDPFPGSRNRRLYVYRKVRETPPGYPRRPGMARKRPLRAGSAAFHTGR